MGCGFYDGGPQGGRCLHLPRSFTAHGPDSEHRTRHQRNRPPGIVERPLNVRNDAEATETYR